MLYNKGNHAQLKRVQPQPSRLQGENGGKIYSTWNPGERYFKVFPRNHILVLQSEDFFSDLRKHLRMIFEFVGVDPTYQIHDLKPRNVAPNRVDVGQEVYEYLTRFFKPHNEELSEFLGQDFGWSSGDNRNDFD